MIARELPTGLLRNNGDQNLRWRTGASRFSIESEQRSLYARG